MTSNELKERLTDTLALLSIPGVGRGRYHRLVSRFGTPAGALAASMSDLETVPRISLTVAQAIKSSYDGVTARQIASRIIQLGWSVLFPGEGDYPELLNHISQPPPILFRLGDPPSPNDKMIAIIGTRHATEKGMMFTRRLASGLAQQGVVVISGMAEGIDTAAHRGALDGGGKTIAVWGTSLDIVYPQSNRSLAAEIRGKGAVYSEYLPETRPDKSTFPERNRIISGMSEGAVVVEAGVKSGALITAACAAEQGRELFAVPGAPDAGNSVGTNSLIKKGASLLTEVDDIFEQLPRLKGEVAARRFKALPDLTEMERKVVDLLSEGPLQIDQLSRQTDLPVSEMMGFVLALEMKGIVQELFGKRFVLAE